MGRKLKYVAIAFAAVAAGAQFVQPDRANPRSDPALALKPTPQAAAVIERACRDCHSNQTTWPWYSRVAPVSWMVAADVQEARARLNFSEWGRFGPEMSAIRAREVCQEASTGEMPPGAYTLIHRNARPREDGVRALCGMLGEAQAAK
jgi:hypothetical protein